MDLGAPYHISRVEVKWGTSCPDTYFVQTSRDGERFTSSALALGREGWTVTVLGAGILARWVRVYARKGDASRDFGFSIWEMSVHTCQSTMSLSTKGGLLYGRGASTIDGATLQTSEAAVVVPEVSNRGVYVPYYYSTDGYGALGVSGPANVKETRKLPISYRRQQERKAVTWGFVGALELYLMPADSLEEGTLALYDLVGKAVVPPLYAFGFTVSKWGWEDREFIESTLSTFRSEQFPLDAFIVDFEWYTQHNDYKLATLGESDFSDFGFNPVTFPDPAAQLKTYRAKYHVRFSGIRKPRLGNTGLLEQARASGWLLPGGEHEGTYPFDFESVYAYGRNLNFSIAEARKWYAGQLQALLDAGVDFWWNDEGETSYFTFMWWNVAQADGLLLHDPHKRFYSLNRAFSPGMARLGAEVWTGDVFSSWAALQVTPGTILNWGLAGAPYVGCDIGGFTRTLSGPLVDTDPQLLVRWMQVGVFLPLMRTHSAEWTKAHFPWLYGPEAAHQLRQALNLRYRLLPYHYSMAHAQYARQRVWMRPLAMAFPEDATARKITSQWLDGDILACPVLQYGGLKDIYLPKGHWYRFNSTATTTGPVHLKGTAAMDEIPAYVRSGTIVVLGPVVQSTDEMPGGPLEIQVYRGGDATFELVEDDGETSDYRLPRPKHVRRTRFRWHEDSGTLAWEVTGSTSSPRAYTLVTASIFNLDATSVQRIEARPFTEGSAGPSEIQI